MIEPATVSVVVADDHDAVRQGLAALLEGRPRYRLVGAAASLAETLALLAAERPDVLVLDKSLGPDDALQHLEQLQAASPATRILVLSMHDEDMVAAAALRRGAQGYLMKQAPVAEVLAALEAVAGGGHWLSPALRERGLGPAAARRGPALSPREREVLRLLATGLGSREIAARLAVATKTVDAHKFNIRAKLGLDSTTDLLRYCVNNPDLLDEPSA